MPTSLVISDKLHLLTPQTSTAFRDFLHTPLSISKRDIYWISLSLLLLVFAMCPCEVDSAGPFVKSNGNSQWIRKSSNQFYSSYNFSQTIAQHVSKYTGVDPHKPHKTRKFFNQCSKGYLEMNGNSVSANGQYYSPFVYLRVQTESLGGHVRITSQINSRYLCFNKRKRITARYNGRSIRCVFKERMAANHKYELESAWKEGLFLGFNKRGRFLTPTKYMNRRRCFQYTVEISAKVAKVVHVRRTTPSPTSTLAAQIYFSTANETTLPPPSSTRFELTSPLTVTTASPTAPPLTTPTTPTTPTAPTTTTDSRLKWLAHQHKQEEIMRQGMQRSILDKLRANKSPPARRAHRLRHSRNKQYHSRLYWG